MSHWGQWRLDIDPKVFGCAAPGIVQDQGNTQERLSKLKATSPHRKIIVTCKSPVGDISAVTLIRTDTTLDHSQKAEKVCWHMCAPRAPEWPLTNTDAAPGPTPQKPRSHPRAKASALPGISAASGVRSTPHLTPHPSPFSHLTPTPTPTLCPFPPAFARTMLAGRPPHADARTFRHHFL